MSGCGCDDLKENKLTPFDEAIEAYQTVIDEYPNSEYGPQAKFKMAKVSYQAALKEEHQIKTDEAITRFKSFKKGMKNFGDNMAIVVNSVLLSFVYIIGIGLTSIFAKLFGKKFLETKRRSDSYWSDLNLKKKPIEEYYRQF